MAEEKFVREKPIPEDKKKLVITLTEKIKSSRTVLIASIKGLPTSHFQKIKKALRGKAEIFVAKKSIVLRAIGETKKGTLQNLKKEIGADIALIFSDMEAFSLASLLVDSQSPAKAKGGDIAPTDVVVEPGPTELMPGPAISELGAVGLKVAVENGKLAIKKQTTIVKEGEVISDNVASVMAKLNILPMKAGFLPLVAYDSDEETIYTDIKIDKEGTLAELKNAIGKALGFAVNVGYTVKETISYFIAKAGAEEKALAVKIGEGTGEKKEEGEKEEDKSAESEEKKEEESKVEEEGK